MIELRTTHIRPQIPKREWLLRCVDNDQKLSVCAICVSDGSIEIITEDHTIVGLDGSYLADFLGALQSAVEQAEADLAERQSGIQDK